jgi:hypothetical protein
VRADRYVRDRGAAQMLVKRIGSSEPDVDDLVPPTSFAASDADGARLLRLLKLLNECVRSHHRYERRAVWIGDGTRRSGLVAVEKVRE